MHKGLHPTGGFLALLLAETHSAIWTEAGIREVAQDSWAQVIIDCVSSGKKLHHSESHFSHPQNWSSGIGPPDCCRAQ